MMEDDFKFTGLLVFKEVRNDLYIEYVQEIGDKGKIDVEIRYRNVTWGQAIDVLETYTDGQVKSFTWE